MQPLPIQQGAAAKDGNCAGVKNNSALPVTLVEFGV